MGVAVAGHERPHSVPPGTHGGNIDINLLQVGATLYLPVQVPGALAYVGDPHFAQGDGEVALTALEASLRVTLRFDVVPAVDALARFGAVRGPARRDAGVPGAHRHGRRSGRGRAQVRPGGARAAAGAVGSRRAPGVRVPVRGHRLQHLAGGRPGLRGARAHPQGRPGGDRRDDAPADLQEAFDAYERALADDDVEALDDAFAPGEDTLRGDAPACWSGTTRSARSAAARGGITPRVLDRVESRRLADDCWLVVATSRYEGGGTGLQTQVWQLRRRAVADHGRARDRPHAAASTAPSGGRSATRSTRDAFDGPLLGLRVAVKDVFAVRGYRIGAGNPTWLRDAARERQHAPAVLDLLKAGASVRGLARTDELAYSIAGANPHYGTPANGAVAGALPGGSSSGPATAVATGQADVGLASDTAGSIRVPASYQGLWGLRTTHGLVPRQGMVPLAPSFDTVGWLTRDGATLDAVVTWCLEDDAPPLPSRRVVPVEVLQLVEPATREAFEAWSGGDRRGGRGRPARRVVRGLPRRAGRRGVAGARRLGHRAPGRRRTRRARAVRDRARGDRRRTRRPPGAGRAAGGA